MGEPKLFQTNGLSQDLTNFLVNFPTHISCPPSHCSITSLPCPATFAPFATCATSTILRASWLPQAAKRSWLGTGWLHVMCMCLPLSWEPGHVHSCPSRMGTEGTTEPKHHKICVLWTFTNHKPRQTSIFMFISTANSFTLASPQSYSYSHFRNPNHPFNLNTWDSNLEQNMTTLLQAEPHTHCHRLSQSVQDTGFGQSWHMALVWIIHPKSFRSTCRFFK